MLDSYLYLSIYDFLGKITGGLKIWSVILASTYLYKYIYFLGLWFWKFWKFWVLFESMYLYCFILSI